MDSFFQGSEISEEFTGSPETPAKRRSDRSLIKLCDEWEQHWTKHNKDKSKVRAIRRDHRDKDLRSWVSARDVGLGEDLQDKARTRGALRQWFRDLQAEALNLEAQRTGMPVKKSQLTKIRVPAAMLLDPLALVGYAPDVVNHVDKLCSVGDGKLDVKAFMEVILSDVNGHAHLRRLHKQYGSSADANGRAQVLSISTALAKYRREQLMNAYTALSLDEDTEGFAQGMQAASYKLAQAAKEGKSSPGPARQSSGMSLVDVSAESLAESKQKSRRDRRLSSLTNSLTSIPNTNPVTPHTEGWDRSLFGLMDEKWGRRASSRPNSQATQQSSPQSPLLNFTVKDNTYGFSGSQGPNILMGAYDRDIETPDFRASKKMETTPERVKKNAQSYLSSTVKKELMNSKFEPKWADYDVMQARMKSIKQNLRPLIRPQTSFDKTTPLDTRRQSPCSQCRPGLSPGLAKRHHSPQLRRVLSPEGKQQQQSASTSALLDGATAFVTHTPLSKRSFVTSAQSRRKQLSKTRASSPGFRSPPREMTGVTNREENINHTIQSPNHIAQNKTNEFGNDLDSLIPIKQW